MRTGDVLKMIKTGYRHMIMTMLNSMENETYVYDIYEYAFAKFCTEMAEREVRKAEEKFKSI